MKYPVELNDTARDIFLLWVAENCKDSAKFDDGNLLAPEAWLEDFNGRLNEDSSRRDYEISSFESASGSPELFYFSDDDLLYEEFEE
tara:strand:+ start:408 stop:668 length:261 start_codon:yes stop_codon:yes gene_type:complete